MQRHGLSISGRFHSGSRGFSLIELMVAVSIMTLVTGVVVVQFNGFDSAIVTKARAYDAAQAVRATQAYATQIRATSTADTTFALQYITRFTKGSNEIVILSKDGANEARPVEYQQLTAGYKVIELRIVQSNSGVMEVRCAPSSGQSLDLGFKRPEVAAHATASWLSGSSPIIRSYIGISGTNINLVQWIEISQTGSVVVTKNPPICP